MSKNQQLTKTTYKEGFGHLANVQGGALLKTIEQNLGGEKLTPFDLSRIKVPGSAGLFWEIVDPLEGPRSLQELDFIILHTQITRAYYKQGFEETGGGTPPDCVSDDGIRGVGDPGGICEDCPLSEWDSSEVEDSRAQACAQRRFMFILRAGEVMPDLLSVPPGSLSSVKKYLFALAMKQRPFFSVVTRFTLEKRQSSGRGIDYSRIVPSSLGPIPDDQLSTLEGFISDLMPIFKTAARDAARERDEEAEDQPED